MSFEKIAEDLKSQLEQEKDRVLRISAEFENYKKRMVRDTEKEQNIRLAGFVLNFLPVLDNLERALRTEGNEVASYQKGVELTLQTFNDALARMGVERIHAKGKPFDPKFHEALATEEKQGVEDGTVLDEFEAGYRMGAVVLRPARVRIARNIVKTTDHSKNSSQAPSGDKPEPPSSGPAPSADSVAKNKGKSPKPAEDKANSTQK